jgi:dTDP-4-amino-4,6-dideoxygalactose transaminase
MISKVALNPANFRRKLVMCNRARDGFSAYLKAVEIADDECVLLPAYIGWSAREGSGVFDPVAELRVKHSFYAMDEFLNIDLASLKRSFQQNKVNLFVIIHYFGFVDPHYEEAIAVARDFGVKVLEDEAHSFYTNFVGGVTGIRGDASIFSLHKMFPMQGGGILSITDSEQKIVSKKVDVEFPAVYDFAKIAKKRVENTLLIAKLLEGHSDKVIIMRPYLNQGEVPQTYPILIKTVSRDKLYAKMNEVGFGVVSLYHTMIDLIVESEYPKSHFVAKRILNLPVHQDVDSIQIKAMVKMLLEQVNSLELELE